MQSSSMFRGIIATRRKRRKTTITQNGIQQILNANTIAKRDLLSLISCKLRDDNALMLCCRITLATLL